MFFSPGRRCGMPSGLLRHYALRGTGQPRLRELGGRRWRSPEHRHPDMARKYRAAKATATAAQHFCRALRVAWPRQDVSYR